MADTAHILVVDDEADTDALYNQKFRQQIASGKYRFTYFDSAAKALEQIRANNDFDLVMTEMNLPEMDGLALLREIADPSIALKAVVVTAYGDIQNIRKAMNGGAYDFCTKPIEFDDLEKCIDRAIEHVRNIRQSQASQSALNDIKQELEVSARLQQSILPKEFPLQVDIALHAEMNPALEVGGDFYDYFWLDALRIGFVIADVSGKNISAGIYAAVVRTLLRSTAFFTHSPGDCLIRVNQVLASENESSMFTTAFYAIFDIEESTLSYASAGHCPPFHVKADGTVRQFETPLSLPLGILEENPIVEETLQMEKGDTILLYTDGVTEAFNIRNEEFGDARIFESLKTITDKHPQELIQHLVKDVRAFVAGAPPSDDMTCIALKYLGSPVTPGVNTLYMRLRNHLEEIAKVVERIENFCGNHKVSPETVFNIVLVVDELITNIINYGFPNGGDHLIGVDMKVEGDLLQTRLMDSGISFDPLKKADADVTSLVEDRQIGGLGIHLTKTFMTRVGYERRGEYNVLTLDLDLSDKRTV